MAVTLGIVRAYDGAIFVQSALGRGTTVRVFFPVHQVDEECRRGKAVKLLDKGGKGNAHAA